MGQSYIFDRKLSEEEIKELVRNYEYDPDNCPDDGGAIWDKFGNPTEATICAMYEDEHDIGYGPFTPEEFDDWLDEVRAEADAEIEAERNNEADRSTKRLSA